MKPLADQDRAMSNVLFLDQSERIEIGYFTYNLTGRKTNINIIINFLIKGDFQTSVKINMTPHAKEVKLNSEKKSCKS